MLEHPPEQDDVKLYTLSAWLLRTGNAVSVALLVVGMVLLWGRGEHFATNTRALLLAWRSLLRGEAAGFLEVGLQMVVLTPILLSLAVCLFALGRRDRSLLLPSLLVILGLGFSLWLGIAR